jgi:hypothetical protein
MIWDNMMWGSDYPHSESTFPQSRKILAEILAGVPDDEQAKPAPDHDPGIAGGNTPRVYKFDVARLSIPARSDARLALSLKTWQIRRQAGWAIGGRSPYQVRVG